MAGQAKAGAAAKAAQDKAEAQEPEVQEPGAEVTQEAQEPEAKLNKDGLVPGQPVDFETARRIERKYAKTRLAEDAKARAEAVAAAIAAGQPQKPAGSKA